MSKFSRAVRFLLTGIFLLTLIFPAHAIDVVNNNSDGSGSLAWAVEQSNAGAGSVITISPSVKILHLSRELTFTRSTTVIGNGALIDGEETRRLFRVTDGRVVFRGLAFTRGNAVVGNGGAVEVDGSGASAEFQSCIFYGNKARDYGGAVCVTKGDEIKPTIFRACTFTSNSAQNGAGLAVTSGTVHVFTSIILGNNGNNDIHAAGGTVHTRYCLMGSANFTPDASDMAGQTVSNVLVSENGAAKIETVSGTQVIRITKDSPAYNITTDPQYSASNDIAGTIRPQFGAYDAGAYEIPAVALVSVKLEGLPPYMQVNTSSAFSLDINPANASLSSVVWHSTNPSVISADASGVHALAIGSGDIWVEVSGWDANGKPVSMSSNPVKVRAGDEAFSKLRPVFLDYIENMNMPPNMNVATISPRVLTIVDRYELNVSDGVSYELSAWSSRPEIVSVEVSGKDVILRAGNTEGSADVTIAATALPSMNVTSYDFTVYVDRYNEPEIVSVDVRSDDLPGGVRGTGQSSGGCNSGVMILAGIVAAMLIRKER